MGFHWKRRSGTRSSPDADPAATSRADIALAAEKYGGHRSIEAGRYRPRRRRDRGPPFVGAAVGRFPDPDERRRTTFGRSFFKRFSVTPSDGTSVIIAPPNWPTHAGRLTICAPSQAFALHPTAIGRAFRYARGMGQFGLIASSNGDFGLVHGVFELSKSSSRYSPVAHRSSRRRSAGHARIETLRGYFGPNAVEIE